MQKQLTPLANLLLSAHLISESDLIRCLQIQKETGDKFGDIVVREGFVSEEKVLQLLSEQMGFPIIDLRRVEIEEDALKIIKEDTAKRNNIFPVSVKEQTLTIATSDPLNMSMIDDLYLITGYEMDVVVATRQDIEWAINRYYLPQGTNEKEADKLVEKKPLLELEDVEEQSAPAIILVQSIVTKAVVKSKRYSY